jgi:electron transport complex protein RnfD
MRKKNYNNLSITYAPHAVTDLDTRKVMMTVILALIPAMAVGVYQFGYQALIQIVLCIAA